MTKTKSTSTSAAWGGLALATAIIASTCFPGIAAAQEADRVWAGCTLDAATVAELRTDMDEDGLGSDTQVAFVVVYSFLENDGQPLSGDDFTGPVICRAPGVSINQVQQTRDISNVDVLDVENAIIVRSTAGKRYCHTVDANEDCFDLSP